MSTDKSTQDGDCIVDHAGCVKLGFTDIDGILRGKMINSEKYKKSINKGLGFCNVAFAWDMHDKLFPDDINASWNHGYPDAQCRLDPATLRLQPWERQQPFILGDFRDDPAISAICPRTLLHRISEQASSQGYTVNVAAEYEWYNFQQDDHQQTPAFKAMTEGMYGYSLLRLSQKDEYVNDLWTYLKAFGVPLEGLHTETGPGVYEAAIQYTDLKTAADRATLFKYAVKCISANHDIIPSFMAKWNANLPGCSGHIHQSIADAKGKNLFYSDNSPSQRSQLMDSYLAGILHCMPYIMPLYAPTINSYKRLVGDWAATTISWGEENRTTAIRTITDGPTATRIETRLPGADANPYLAMAATVASGLYGIRQKLQLTQAPVTGSAYDTMGLSSTPTTLRQAIAQMKISPIAVELFGQGFVDHFIMTREWECSQYERAITDWELNRYREII